jgi:hypothetical protein
MLMSYIAFNFFTVYKILLIYVLCLWYTIYKMSLIHICVFIGLDNQQAFIFITSLNSSQCGHTCQSRTIINAYYSHNSYKCRETGGVYGSARIILFILYRNQTHGAQLHQQLVKKYPQFLETQKHIAVFTKFHHLFLSWARTMQSITFHLIYSE